MPFMLSYLVKLGIIIIMTQMLSNCDCNNSYSLIAFQEWYYLEKVY